MKTKCPGTKIPINQPCFPARPLSFRIRWLAFFIGAMVVSLTNCTTDNLAPEGNQPPIKVRTCDPGDYTIEDGRIVFQDSDEYLATIDFLNCATSSEIED